MFRKRLMVVLLAPIMLFSFDRHLSAAIVSSPSFSALTTAVAADTNIQLNFDGVVIFTSPIAVTKPVTIDASGRSVIFDGSGTTQLFHVTNGGDLTLTSVNLRNGSSPNREPGSSGYGGAIFLTNGSLTLNKCTASGNNARGIQGYITTISTNLSGLTVIIGGTSTNSGSAYGGAIYARAGRITLNDCIFENNSATGPDGLFKEFQMYLYPGLSRVAIAPGLGWGGAVNAAECQLNINRCTFKGNRVSSGIEYFPSGQFNLSTYRASASGGAIYAWKCTASIQSSSFSQNDAGNGGGGNGSGGAISLDGDNCSIADSSFINNSISGEGAAMALSATGLVRNCAFIGNSAQAGPATACTGGALVHKRPLQLTTSIFSNNRAIGGVEQFVGGPRVPYRPAGRAEGGAVASLAALRATNCIFYGNSVRSGNGSLGPSVPGVGGAIATFADAFITHSSFAENLIETASGTDPALSPKGSALWANTNSTVTVQACALSRRGSVSLVETSNLIDGGFNVIAEASPRFSVPTTLTNSDPLLQFFPNARLSILRPAPNSPAIDRVTTKLAEYDIRGVLRPEHGSDSGAVELTGSIPLSITPTNGRLQVTAKGFAEPLKLLATSDFKSWTILGTATPPNGSQPVFEIDTAPPYLFFKVQLDP